MIAGQVMSVFDKNCGCKDLVNVEDTLIHFYKIFGYVGFTFKDLQRAIDPIKIKHAYLKPVLTNSLQRYADFLSVSPFPCS